SNRDEKQVRKSALPPRPYRHNDATLFYPKDAEAGGTWIAMKDNGDAAVLLNGGFRKHIPAPPYRKSRGLVFLDVAEAAQPEETFINTPLDNIEPFTMILYVAGTLLECRWDGYKKHCKLLDGTLPHTWSSVTLYDAAVRQKREAWFDEWLTAHPSPSVNDVLHFHHFGGDGDTANDIRMRRGNVYSTVSITVMQLTGIKNTMHYFDLNNNHSFTTQIDVAGVTAV
ncbi:MAG TPA: NRDE family protein, partial [Chitinophagaceae bacterium]|nr:NRDE family protein [Chitinophagaceae bacterium]